VQAVSDKILTSSNKARRHCPSPLARRHIKILSSLFASLLFVIAFILALLTVFRTLGYTCLDASEEASFFCLVFDGKTVFGVIVMAKKDDRIIITLACGTCKRRNYTTMKNKKNDPERLNLEKYCKFCRKHVEHKETKK
jgi:large subunit ribosomal protein L33